ncbi:2 TM domain-containing transmembrane protein [Acrasis kona]|uniref:2 TM domain-containing transmembrane protein n=1 Tax=Acrasis kona TaxID=1008807 RepID=A0AAW2ZAA9_9EUKA
MKFRKVDCPPITTLALYTIFSVIAVLVVAGLAVAIYYTVKAQLPKKYTCSNIHTFSTNTTYNINPLNNYIDFEMFGKGSNQSIGRLTFERAGSASPMALRFTDSVGNLITTLGRSKDSLINTITFCNGTQTFSITDKSENLFKKFDILDATNSSIIVARVTQTAPSVATISSPDLITTYGDLTAKTLGSYELNMNTQPFGPQLVQIMFFVAALVTGGIIPNTP